MSILKDLYNRIKGVKNLEQACDATLVHYFSKVEKITDIELIKETHLHAPIEASNHSLYEFSLWGVANGFTAVPEARPCCSCFESLRALKFTAEDMKSYSHIIYRGKRLQLTGVNKGEALPFVTIYRLYDNDRHQIVTGYF